jgi:hypothetical protein
MKVETKSTQSFRRFDQLAAGTLFTFDDLIEAAPNKFGSHRHYIKMAVIMADEAYVNAVEVETGEALQFRGNAKVIPHLNAKVVIEG